MAAYVCIEAVGSVETEGASPSRAANLCNGNGRVCVLTGGFGLQILGSVETGLRHPSRAANL